MQTNNRQTGAFMRPGNGRFAGRFGMGLLCLGLALFSAGCAHQKTHDPHDPFESINRDIYAFNMTLDRYLLRPTAKGYQWLAPDLVERGVDNFLTNLFYPRTIINNFLQGKLVAGGQDIGRFVLNTTVGVLGIFDVASRVGLPLHQEDFGQTLGYWGLGDGAYLVLPLLGPSTSRDFSGRVVDIAFTPTTYMEPTPSFVITAMDIINLRVKLLKLDRALEEAFDPYAFVRGGYLQTRRSQVYDGNPPIEEDDYYLIDDDPALLVE